MSTALTALVAVLVVTAQARPSDYGSAQARPAEYGSAHIPAYGTRLRPPVPVLRSHAYARALPELPVQKILSEAPKALSQQPQLPLVSQLLPRDLLAERPEGAQKPAIQNQPQMYMLSLEHNGQMSLPQNQGPAGIQNPSIQNNAQMYGMSSMEHEVQVPLNQGQLPVGIQQPSLEELLQMYALSSMNQGGRIRLSQNQQPSVQEHIQMYSMPLEQQESLKQDQRPIGIQQPSMQEHIQMYSMPLEQQESLEQDQRPIGIQHPSMQEHIQMYSMPLEQQESLEQDQRPAGIQQPSAQEQPQMYMQPLEQAQGMPQIESEQEAAIMYASRDDEEKDHQENKGLLGSLGSLLPNLIKLPSHIHLNLAPKLNLALDEPKKSSSPAPEAQPEASSQPQESAKSSSAMPEKEEEEVSTPSPKPYQFHYIARGENGTVSRTEKSDGRGRVEGSYSIMEADGRKRVVHYIADDQGYRAKIETNEPGTLSLNPADVLMDSSAPNPYSGEADKSSQPANQEQLNGQGAY